MDIHVVSRSTEQFPQC